MNQRFPSMPMPAPIPPAASMHANGISQYVTGGSVPDRLKTNEEWAAEASAAADAAAAGVLRKATVQRLHVLHDNIIGYVAEGTEVPAELAEEYATLIGG